MPSSRWARPTIRRLPGSTTLPARPSGATPGFCLSMVLARSWSSSTREAARSISLWTSTVTSSRRSSMKTARVTFSAYLASALISLVMPAGEASAAPSRFISVTPCRQYDSRHSTPLPQNTARAVVVSGAPCGLPAGIAAVSVNITIFNISGATANGVFQVGTATAPTFAWINFPPTEAQRGNAGALPLDSLGQLWVRVQQGGGQIDFTVDVNGYYAATSPGSRLASGEFFGIFGTRSGDGVIYGENDSPTTSSTGVRGTSSAGSGATFGVWGTTNSTGLDAAGIFGMDATGPGTTATGFLSAGVRGESATQIGVRG